MPTKTETRQHRTGEIRATALDGQPEGTMEVLAVAYDVVDDYGTRFVPGVFNDSLQERLPTLTFGHSWQDPIGRATAWREAEEGLYLTFRLDLHDDVPRARQAWAQISSGTLDDVSVGFVRQADRTADDGVEEITKAVLDEVGVVLRGAVPGAKVLLTRSAGGTVEVDAAVEIARRKVAGEITEAEADEALRLLALDDGEGGADVEPPPAAAPAPTTTPTLSEEEADALAAADAALDSLTERTSPRSPR